MGYNAFEGRKNAKFQEEWYTFLQHKFNPLKRCPKKYGEYPNYQTLCSTCKECVKHFVLLWPRGHAKTECTTINYVSWLVGNHPNIHIDIVTKTASLAEEILLTIMSRMESDEHYIEIFGELKPKDPKKWTNCEIIVNRTENSKNPTIKATGLRGPVTGTRSDLIICDDIIDEENVITRLQLERATTWFNKILYPTLQPWGGIIVIGTRWSYADIYNDLLNTWPHDIKQATLKDGTPLWPENWTLEKLAERRNQIGSIIYACQYMNDPTGMEGDLLKSEWLQSWDYPPSSGNIKYAGVDPALGEGDYQAIATLSIDKTSKQGFLEDVWAEAIPFPQFLQKLRHLHEVNNYAKIFVEANAFQKVLTFMQELAGLPIVTSQTSKDKEQRFIPMSSHFESKRILVNPLLNLKSEFWTEWVQFPRGQHDDALDAVEIVTRETVGQHRQGFVFLGK